MFTHPDLSLFHPLDWPDTALTFCRLRDFTCPLLAIIRVFRIAAVPAYACVSTAMKMKNCLLYKYISRF